MKKIVCSAIKDSTGKVWLGKRHSDCFFLMSRFGVDVKGHTQGFVNDKGTFLLRKEAYQQARESGQISDRKNLPLRDLFSEDIY